jgi:hypothetical protein
MHHPGVGDHDEVQVIVPEPARGKRKQGERKKNTKHQTGTADRNTAARSVCKAVRGSHLIAPGIHGIGSDLLAEIKKNASVAKVRTIPFIVPTIIPPSITVIPTQNATARFPAMPYSLRVLL